METRQLILRSLDPSDLSAVATVHAAAFTDSILTKLGKEAVCRYYQWLLEGPHEMYAIGALLDGRLAGFLFGGIAPDAIPGFMRTNRGLLAQRLALRPWLVADPLFRDRIGRVVRNATRPHRSAPVAAAQAARKRPFDVISVAVDPRAQGEGIGKRLMREAESIARSNRFHVMTLMVHVDNRQAIGFYESLGWQKLLRQGSWQGNMELWFER
jgi:ribosomal protein S18 acetylase RimI-like enzyme